MSKRCLTCGMYSAENKILKTRVRELEAALRNATDILDDEYPWAAKSCRKILTERDKLIEKQKLNHNQKNT